MTSSVVDFNKDFNIIFEIKPLETTITTSEENIEQEEVSSEQIQEDTEYEILSVQPSHYPSLCIMQPSSKLVLKLSESSVHIIEHALPKEKYSNVSIQRSGSNVMIDIVSNDLDSEPYHEVLSDTSYEENMNKENNNQEYYLCGPSSTPASVEVKNLTITGNMNKESDKNNNSNEEQPKNHVMMMDLGECKYHLSDLDHILIEQTNSHKVENKIISEHKDWETQSPKGYIAGGIRNILYKDCENNIIQNYNVSANIVRELSVYKKPDGTLELPSIYLIYNKDHYESEEDVITYTRDFYNDEVIQIIGSFSYGSTKNQIYSYDQMLRNSDYNPENNNGNMPACADTEINIHGCCPDGVTPSDDVYGSNCPPLSCRFTQYGCCKDGFTTSNDEMGTNCPPI